MTNIGEYVHEKIDFLRNISRYKTLFLSPSGKKILMDLAKFCKYDDTIFDKDPNTLARNEGRRQVFLYILNQINYSVNDVLGTDFDEADDQL